jgi:hypothetical protein
VVADALVPVGGGGQDEVPRHQGGVQHPAGAVEQNLFRPHGQRLLQQARRARAANQRAEDTDAAAIPIQLINGDIYALPQSGDHLGGADVLQRMEGLVLEGHDDRLRESVRGVERTLVFKFYDFLGIRVKSIE